MVILKPRQKLGVLVASGGSRSKLFWLLALSLVCGLVLGGGPTEYGLAATIIIVSGTLILGLSIAKGAHRDLSRLPAFALLLCLLIVLAPVLQLLPLPPGLYALLPGREVERQVFEAVGMASSWKPLTSTPVNTALALLMLIPLAGIVLATASLESAEIDQAVGVVLLVLAVTIIVGSVQVVSAGTALRFFRRANHGFLLGFFANKNHAALFLSCAILFCSYLATRVLPVRQSRTLPVALTIIILYAVVLGTGSRAGLVLGALAALCATAIFLPFRGRQVFRLAGATGAVVLLAVGLLSTTGNFQRLVGRFGDVQEDARWDIWRTGAPAIWDYFPAGSGLGSFVGVYNKYEGLETLSPNFANAMHSDIAELSLEIGVLAPAIGILLLWLMVASFRRARAWPVGSGPRHRAMMALAVIALMLLHSLIDYPLRRMAIAVIFAFCLGLLFRLWSGSDKEPERVGRAGDVSDGARYPSYGR
jgi:O-antigen ligase